jgi:hypothetical protein
MSMVPIWLTRLLNLCHAVCATSSITLARFPFLADE